MCYAARVQDVGRQSTVRNGAVAGTTGQGRRMEALGVRVGTGPVTAQAHVADHGRLNAVSGNPVYVGTTGQSDALML